MTALLGGFGPDWVIREIPVPEPGPGQVLVRTRMLGLNNAEPRQLVETDPAHGGSRQYVAGHEFAGEVAVTGTGADRFSVGDPVMGLAPQSFAEFVVVDERHLIRIPAGLDDREACALPIALVTEHGALCAGEIRPGQVVLITGAGS